MRKSVAAILLENRWPTALAQGIHPLQTQADIIEVNSYPSAHLSRRHIRTGSLRSAQGRGGSSRRCLDALPGRPQRRDNDGKRLTTCWDPWAHVELKGTMYTFWSMDGLWQGRMLVRYAFLLLLSGLSPRL